MTNNTYGYVRVSTHEQNEARQLIAMRDFGVPEENIITRAAAMPSACRWRRFSRSVWAT